MDTRCADAPTGTGELGRQLNGLHRERHSVRHESFDTFHRRIDLVLRASDNLATACRHDAMILISHCFQRVRKGDERGLMIVGDQLTARSSPIYAAGLPI